MRNKPNIYKLFHCSGKEELYKKIKNDHPDVQKLKNFIEYSKLTIHEEKEPLNKPKKVCDILSKISIPNKNELIILFLDAKNRITQLEKMDLQTSKLRDVFTSAFSSNCKSTILAYSNDCNISEIRKMRDLLTKLKLSPLDEMVYFEDISSYQSLLEDEFYPLENNENNETFEIKTKEENFQLYDGFNEFSNYYLKNEIIALSILRDIDAIKENLKFAFQEKNQEEIGVIIYDKYRKVKSMEIVSIGSATSSIAHPKDILARIFNHKDSKGFILFHNHPSGANEPSIEDMNITRLLLEVSKRFQVEFADHFIVAKEGVFSFAQNAILDFSDKKYNQSLEEDPLKYDMHYNLKEQTMDYER